MTAVVSVWSMNSRTESNLGNGNETVSGNLDGEIKCNIPFFPHKLYWDGGFSFSFRVRAEMSRFCDLLLRSSRMQREGVWMLLQASLALVASATCFAPLHHLPAIRHSSASACTQRSFLSQDGRRNPRFVLRMQIDDVLSPQWDDPMPQWDDKPTKTQEPASEMPKGSAAEVKQKLLYACGLCDRGFSASMKERNEIGALINKLGTLSPLDAPSAGIDGPTLESDDIPLRGVWRLVYTSAIDVLNLWASPLVCDPICLLINCTPCDPDHVCNAPRRRLGRSIKTFQTLQSSST